MTITKPQFGDENLAADAHRAVVSKPIGNISYPLTCPCCGQPATSVLQIAKPFMFSSGGETGWSYRVGIAQPLFCQACIARHQTLESSVTPFEMVTSVLSQELVIPAVGLGLFGGFLMLSQLPAFLRNPSEQWPIIAGAAVMLIIALHSAHSAWRNGAYKRIPAPSKVSVCFDFGDNDDSPTFAMAGRTYAFSNAEYAAAFEKLNIRP